MNLLAQYKKTGFLPLLFSLSFFGVGIFHPFAACLLSAVLLVWLTIRFFKEKQLRLPLNFTTALAAVTVLFYGLSTLWAVDSGMAFTGFLKFLPVFLFLFALQQERSAGPKILQLFPYLATVAALLSAIGMQIPFLKTFFAVDGRLAGFLQYPNTFALVLLVAELLILGKDKRRIYDLICLPVLIFGLLYTGSRTVFVLAVLANLSVLLFSKSKKLKIGVLCGILAVAAALGGYALISGGLGIFGRFLTISLESSTFLGRFLYFQDALPVILKHPFGLGYAGYYYLQQSFQTGIYSVMFIHNDLLQLMLDIGWLPALLFAVTMVRTFFRGTPTNHKIILAVFLLHGCFDFNLQFVAVFVLLFLFTDYQNGKELILRTPPVTVGAFAATAMLCLYCGTALALADFGLPRAAHLLYPWNTQNETLLLTTDEPEAANRRADRILKQNPYVTLAHSAKARYAYSKGDFTNLILHKNKLFQAAPFQYEEYKEYCYMLINGIALYQCSGDAKSANICRQELLTTQKRVQAQTDRLSKLGAKINDQPTTELPADIQNYIAQMEGSK